MKRVFGKDRMHEHASNASEFAARAKVRIEHGLHQVGNEAQETREMAHSFFRMLEHKLDLNGRTTPPSEEEVKEAVEQLKDVGRFSVFTTAIILPGGAVSLIGLEMLARKFGIKFTFIPSSFRKNAEWKHPRGGKRKLKSTLNKRRNNIKDITPEEEKD